MRSGHQEPRSSSSCAACKFLKRRCSPNCLFAPYFRSDEPKKFAKVHKVFGASNVSKILNEVAEDQREDTVNSLVYEAEVRLQDPVYGCIGAIASLQHKMVELQHDLVLARARLACCTADHHQLQLQLQLQLQQQHYQQPSDLFFDGDHRMLMNVGPFVQIPENGGGFDDQNSMLPFDQFTSPFQFP